MKDNKDLTSAKCKTKDRHKLENNSKYCHSEKYVNTMWCFLITNFLFFNFKIQMMLKSVIWSEKMTSQFGVNSEVISELDEKKPSPIESDKWHG